jgi:hypothetical protein
MIDLNPMSENLKEYNYLPFDCEVSDLTLLD